MNERIAEIIKELLQEVTTKYKKEKSAWNCGYYFISNERECHSISPGNENFFYWSKSVKKIYFEIDRYTEAIETEPGQLDRYNSRLKDFIQEQLKLELFQHYSRI